MRCLEAYEPAGAAGDPPATTAKVARATEPAKSLAEAGRLAQLVINFLRSLVAEEGAELADDSGAGFAAMAIADNLRKAWQPDFAPVASGLAKLAGEIVPRLDALQKRVEEIAQTPLPPQTIARGFAGISKREDGGGTVPPTEDIVAALARMSDEERTLTLIKAAHANPIAPFSRPAGFAAR